MDGRVAILMLSACAPDPAGRPSAPPSPESPSVTGWDTSEPTDPVDPVDSGTVPPPASVVYPVAPYDCADGVPAGTPAVRAIHGVTGTEGLAFDREGYLVTEQTTSDGSLIRWTRDGTAQLYSPGIGSARGLNLLNTGDVIIASGSAPELWGVTSATGQPFPIAVLPAPGVTPGGRAPAEVDVGPDGTLAVGTLFGEAFAVTPDGDVLPLGAVGQWGMGAAFSVDASRMYFSRWDQGHPDLFVSDRDAAGEWSPVAKWASVPATGQLSGVAVDACDNVYVVSELCRVYRVTPDGQAALLVDLGDTLRFHYSDACRTIVFGRGLGGWDAYSLYASTYDDVAEINVGVPGRPR